MKYQIGREGFFHTDVFLAPLVQAAWALSAQAQAVLRHVLASHKDMAMHGDACGPWEFCNTPTAKHRHCHCLVGHAHSMSQKTTGSYALSY